MNKEEIQRHLTSYAIDSGDDHFWELVRAACRGNNDMLLVGVMSMRIKKLKGSTPPLGDAPDKERWRPTYDKAVHARILADIGAALDVAFDELVNGSDARVELMIAELTARPRLQRPGIERWARDNIEPVGFPRDELLEYDYHRMAKQIKKLPKKSAMRKLIEAEKTLGWGTHSRGRKRKNKKPMTAWDAIDLCNDIIHAKNSWWIEFLNVHLMMQTIDSSFEPRLEDHYEHERSFRDSLFSLISARYEENVDDSYSRRSRRQ